MFHEYLQLFYITIKTVSHDKMRLTKISLFVSITSLAVATPHVSGVAALVWSHFPNLKGEQIRRALEENSVDKGARGYDEYYGHGLVDAKSTYDSLTSGDIPSVCTDSRAE